MSSLKPMLLFRPRTQHKDIYVRIWIMKTHKSSLKPMLLFRPKDSTWRHLRPYLNHKNTNLLIVSYVTVQSQGLSVKYTYVRIRIMKTHLSSLKLMFFFRPTDSTKKHLRPYLYHEDTNFLIVAYAFIQTQGLNIKTRPYLNHEDDMPSLYPMLLFRPKDAA
jgi:hypothetical protein